MNYIHHRNSVDLHPNEKGKTNLLLLHSLFTSPLIQNISQRPHVSPDGSILIYPIKFSAPNMDYLRETLE